MKSFVVALTGGIGSGKTTVANLFHALDVPLIDADIIARQVVEPGSEGLAAIVAHFGSDILLTDGQLNRAKLRQCIFSDQQQKAWLNNLLHPLIRRTMQQRIDNCTAPYCLLVVPLLVENGLQIMADRVLVVDVSEETQIARTVQRDSVDMTQVKQILASQASRAERLAVADDVINNDDQPLTLEQQVAKLHQRYLDFAMQRR
ncbi:dephospho-CoA kinase [Thaumasiovibrio sp. DFM-14]|uniref:dephospho-CoA kinase n=1 Tax=Thaumasiovibrio sp. DFM-14 TaxID=3384792 RepID=UPI0039A27794